MKTLTHCCQRAPFGSCNFWTILRLIIFIIQFSLNLIMGKLVCGPMENRKEKCRQIICVTLKLSINFRNGNVQRQRRRRRRHKYLLRTTSKIVRSCWGNKQKQFLRCCCCAACCDKRMGRELSPISNNRMPDKRNNVVQLKKKKQFTFSRRFPVLYYK